MVTDQPYAEFFRSLMAEGAIRACYDFENRDGIFWGVHRQYRFAILLLTRRLTGADPPRHPRRVEAVAVAGKDAS